MSDRPMARILLLCSLFIAGICAVLGAYALLVYSDPPVDPEWALNGSDEIPEGAVTVRFTGTATLLFSDGKTHWMTDGWFSRPGPLRLLLGEIEPDVEAVRKGLAANGVEQLDAVLPLHSHYDHAMDAPEVARMTGALLLGSESTANIGRGWGLPEEQIRVLVDRQPIQLGKFVITPVESRHFEFPDPAVRERALGDPHITEPLVPPVPVFDYRLGKAWVLHVSHPKGNWLIVGSAGYVEGALEGLSAELVFLGVGGIGAQTSDYREAFWRETVGRVAPSRLIPIHFDGLTAPLTGPFRGPVKVEAWVMGGEQETRRFLQAKAAADSGLRFGTLPRFEPVVLFE